ncbi:hypothetical protein ACFFLM_06240 [Deinococcus oregonensis]|uniref:Uncharacterized protein n=1 Tax=Deinococcus oregonensis TaxID=1805970 RepID=A0ABV6AXZ4_9DEIO
MTWLLWLLGTELLRTFRDQDWWWAGNWTVITALMVCGIRFVLQEGWVFWKESFRRT